MLNASSFETTTHRPARIVILKIILVCCWLLGSCVGIPIRRQTVNHIVATGWTRDGVPIALAQRFHLGRTAYIMSPEGPGKFSHVDPGPLVLLTNQREQPIFANQDDSDLRVENVDQLPAGGDFILLVDVSLRSDTRKSDWHCFRVNADGRTSGCKTPQGFRFEAFSYYLAGNSGEIRYKRISEGATRFEALNVETGKLRAMEQAIQQIPLRFPNDLQGPGAPCDMSYSRVSPQENRMVVVCGLREEGRMRQGIWLLESDSLPKLLYEFQSPTMGWPSYRPSETENFEDLVTWPREEYSLSWSADGQSVYWCGGNGKAGVVVSLGGEPSIEHIPCLLMASWSPDGSQIAGVSNWKLKVWKIPGRSSVPR